MKAQEMRQLTPAELQAKLSGWQDELFRARVRLHTSELKDTSIFKKLRKDIARAKGILGQQQLTAPAPQDKAVDAKKPAEDQPTKAGKA